MQLVRIFLYVLSLFASSQHAFAQQPWPPAFGYPGQSWLGQQPGAPVFRPQTPQPQPSNPPAMPAWQGYQYPSNTAKIAPQPPKVETWVSERKPYEQQSIIYRIRLTSSGDLQTATPILPPSDTVILKPLGEPRNTSFKDGGKTRLVTEYTYLLMPLVAGNLEIPAALISGTYTENGGSFEASAPQSIKLDVQVADTRVQPWLPLVDLRVQTQLSDNTQAAMDKPMTLRVTLIAIGITGAQLPGIQQMLNDSQFRIYPIDSKLEGDIGQDGKLHGRREESFTLVPRTGGWLDIPSPAIAWWNVESQAPEVAASAPRRIHVEGPEQGRINLTGEGQGVPISFWLPLLIAVLLAVLGWMKALFGPGFAVSSLPGRFGRVLLGALHEPVARFISRASPRRHVHQLRRWIGNQLPISWKLWYCLRAVAPEDDPEQWAHALQILANKHLGSRRHVNLKQLGDEILEFHPDADRQQVELLMQDLDQALYGNQPIHNFRLWKKNLQRQIEPSFWTLLSCKRQKKTAQTSNLGVLNPRS